MWADPIRKSTFVKRRSRFSTRFSGQLTTTVGSGRRESTAQVSFFFFSIYINLVCGCLWLPHLCTPPLLFDSLCLLVRFCRVDPAVVHLKHNLLPSCLQMDPPSSISTSCFEAFPPSATTKWYVYNRPMIKINTKLPLATSSFLLVVRPSSCVCVRFHETNASVGQRKQGASGASWRDDAKPQEGANQREEQL